MPRYRDRAALQGDKMLARALLLIVHDDGRLYVESHSPAPTRSVKPRPRPSAEAAKWLRPGVVVHEPCATADALLIDFAGELRARGFRVGGYARKPQPAGASPLSVDLATGASFVEEPRAARRRLEQAISEGADLFAVGRFPASSMPRVRLACRSARPQGAACRC